ncbi:MAG: hypothetical protein MZW92_21510 [Comamonadaceae bacterium]|nr:hypothetical protein [Comamonadaceae bacterium]
MRQAPFPPLPLSRRRAIAALAGGWALTARPAHPAEPLRVGPGRAFERIADAARAARDGDTIEVDAGTYRGDVAVFTQRRLTLRAAGGRARLVADGRAAEGKAIWVLRGGDFDVEGFDFEGRRVPGRNGAGIRFERGRLAVRDCRFVDNEMGLLTSNDPDAELEVERCELAHNLRPDGHNHQLYAGAIRSLVVRGSYLHHASIGHLLKSRAAHNLIVHNRLTDERGGSASYELEFPNGGVAVVVGNLVQQNRETGNPILVSFGAEGWRGERQALVLAHNTLVDDRGGASRFVRVAPGAAVELVAVNNLLCGDAEPLEAAGPGTYRGNVRLPRTVFADADDHDYRPADARALAADAADAGRFDEQPLAPRFEYRHPRDLAPLAGPARRPGALQTPARA